MVLTPELRAQFDRKQARLRQKWEQNQAGVAPAVAVARAVCSVIKQNGVQCDKNATHGGKCGRHHAVEVNRVEQVALRLALTSIRRLVRRRATPEQIDAFVQGALPTVVARLQPTLLANADQEIIFPFVHQTRAVIDLVGTTPEQVQAIVEDWVVDGVLSFRRAELVMEYVRWEFMIRERRLVREANRAPLIGREAQLANDSQNVHTPEVGQQMRDSLAILMAVDVPITQENTMNEIMACLQKQGRPRAELVAVLSDMVKWWNKTMIFVEGDKTYKKAMRGLWWTIKQFKGEVRDELEKRLWDECRDAALPYSVCAQGHLARLTNVMVGFDDAFKPPVSVGEILQQKMATIAGMDVEQEEQVRLARAVLDELKVPEGEHNNWLMAF